MHAILDKFIQRNKDFKFMLYSDFYDIKQIGSGGYGTVYNAKYRKHLEVKDMDEETVVLKRFKDFDEMPELFISEASNNCWY